MNDELTLSKLETALQAAPYYSHIGMVRELDVLRDVRIGKKGTDAQRNTLLRIINHNATAGRPIIDRLVKSLGDSAPLAGILFSLQKQSNDDSEI